MLAQTLTSSGLPHAYSLRPVDLAVCFKPFLWPHYASTPQRGSQATFLTGANFKKDSLHCQDTSLISVKSGAKILVDKREQAKNFHPYRIRYFGG